MATIPIHNPQSPFLGMIPGGFRVGSTIKVRAQIQGFSNRLVINIQSGAALKPRDDCMLHISVRPQENTIVRNTFKNQVWGAEERHGGSPVQAHQSFEIAITAEHSMFRISVNSQHYCTFSHRLPLNLARFISIDGTCTISYITIDQNGAPSMQPSYPPIHHHPTYPTAPSYPGHHHHHPGVTPAPPPMPPMAPPPYPGLYPGHQHPTPYTTSEKADDKKSVKVAAGVGAAVGLTAIALSRAVRRKK